MDPFDDDKIDGGIGAWPAFVDLLAATSLLFVAFLAVVLVSIRGPEPPPNAGGREESQGETIETQRRTIVDALRDTTLGFERVYSIDDTSDVIAVKLILLEEATFPKNRFFWTDLRPEARRALRSIAEKLQASETLKTAYREIRIVGHSDQDPYDRNADYSNWELSASRAAVVARFLATETGLDPCRLSASGYGPYHPAHRPDQTGDQPAAEQRDLMRQNRRVELYFVPTAWESDSARGEYGDDCYRPGDGTSRSAAAEAIRVTPVGSLDPGPDVAGTSGIETSVSP